MKQSLLYKPVCRGLGERGGLLCTWGYCACSVVTFPVKWDTQAIPLVLQMRLNQLFFVTSPSQSPPPPNSTRHIKQQSRHTFPLKLEKCSISDSLRLSCINMDGCEMCVWSVAYFEICSDILVSFNTTKRRWPGMMPVRGRGKTILRQQKSSDFLMSSWTKHGEQTLQQSVSI